jgi:RNA polymerase subunit RPABC4/transcription elongation factor Spt4
LYEEFEAVNRPALDHFPLNRAYLCQDCNAVGNNAMNCPACASTVLLGLAGVLDREEAAQKTKATLPWIQAVAA